MRVQQNGIIWNKFLEEREKYYKNPAMETYEWRFEDCNLVISYNGKSNSINYASNRDSDNGVGLTVKYSKDDKITEVLAYSKENGQRKYNDLMPLLRDLDSDISCLNFSSTSNPFAEVMPLNSPTYKDAILFDVMMRTAYKYIEQENKNVTIAVCYNGHGSAGTPTAKVLQGKNFTTASLNMPYKTEIYNPDTLYSIEYYNQEIDKQIYMKNYVIYIMNESGFDNRFVLTSEIPLTKEDVRLSIKQAMKDFCGTKEGILYLTKEYMRGSNCMSIGDVFYHLKSLPLEKYGLTINKDVCRYSYDILEFQWEEPIITLDELGLKPLNITVEYIAPAQSIALVPKDMSLEQSIEYAEQNMDMIPRCTADVSYSTGEINPELCSFEEEKENSEDRER